MRGPQTERRTAGGEVRAASTRGVFTALAVTYGTVDLYGSAWAPGCFDASLAKRLPVILFGHDHVEPVGRATSWRSLPAGPEVTAQLDLSPDVPRGRQAAAQLASGTLTDVSVGFLPIRRREPTAEERKKWPGVKEVIVEAEMLELSLVGVGAVPGAVVTSSRSAHLARSYAEGRITLAQYRSEVDLETETDDVLDLIARWSRSTPSSLVREPDPVEKWMALAEAKQQAKADREKAAAERARREREQDQAAIDRASTPWSGFR